MNRTITIGRNPQSSIVISEDYDIVSNDHAEIVQEGNDLIFIDHSSNGTIINGQKIQGKTVNIYLGDKIVLAGVYELSWNIINKYVVPVGRPTVARNIRANSGLDDLQREETRIHSERYQQDASRRDSRVTDFMNRDEASHRTSVYDYREQTRREERKATTSSTQIDKEIDKWNWGAFYFGWIWGIFNKVYLALIQLVANIFAFALSVSGLGVIAPFFTLASFGIGIWLGVKGSRLAWDNGAYRNLEHFRNVRHGWNVAAAIVFGITIFVIIISLILFIDVITRYL